jgi:hypothetical protein
MFVDDIPKVSDALVGIFTGCATQPEGAAADVGFIHFHLWKQGRKLMAVFTALHLLHYDLNPGYFPKHTVDSENNVL